MSRKIKIFTVILALFLTGSRGKLATPLPTVQSPEVRLQEEIQKMLDAGHLRPSHINEHEYYRSFLATEGLVNGNMFEYWANPAETIYVLLRALPHISPSMQPALRTYIQSEWDSYPPYQYVHMGSAGAQRENINLPDEAISEYFGKRTKPGNYKPGKAWTGYAFNPFNIYASYLYAKEFGGAPAILDQVRNKVEPLPADSFLQSHLYALNQYIAGYYGYLKLQTLAGESPSATVEGYLNTALQKRLAYLDLPPGEIRGTDEGGFLYLVPELAGYLRQNAMDKVKNQVDAHNGYSAPYWFVANMDELQRLTHISSESGTGREEGGTSGYYAYWSLFQAKAQILNEPRAELEKYLDVPAVERGDLYFIDNLVSTIEAQPAGTSLNKVCSNLGIAKTGGRICR